MNMKFRQLSSSKLFFMPQRGFTLVELMVVVVIIGIGAAIAIPAYQSTIITSRISGGLSDLQAALQFARSEALRRGLPVSICKSTNPEAAVPSCDVIDSVNGSDRGWGQGWIIFVDRGTTGTFEPNGAPPDILVQVQNPIFKRSADGSIIPIKIAGGGEPKFITFTPTGQSFTGAIRFQFNRPTSDTIASHDKYLCLSLAGRWRVSSTSCSN